MYSERLGEIIMVHLVSSCSTMYGDMSRVNNHSHKGERPILISNCSIWVKNLALVVTLMRDKVNLLVQILRWVIHSLVRWWRPAEEVERCSHRRKSCGTSTTKQTPMNRFFPKCARRSLRLRLTKLTNIVGFTSAILQPHSEDSRWMTH